MQIAGHPRVDRIEVTSYIETIPGKAGMVRDPSYSLTDASPPRTGAVSHSSMSCFATTLPDPTIFVPAGTSP